MFECCAEIYNTLHLKLSVLIKDFAVYQNFCIFPCITDHVPVFAGYILSTRFSETDTNCQMERAGNFLIVKDVLGKFGDAETGTLRSSPRWL